MIIDLNIDAKNIFDEYPLLQEIVASLDNPPEITWHQYFRYLSLCYDPDSPLMKKYNDMQTRKRFAALNVQYEGEHYPEIAIMFIHKVIKSRKHRALLSNEFVFDEYCLRVNTPITALDEDKMLKAVELKNKMLQQMSEIDERIDSQRRQLYNDDTELEEVKEMVYTAENIAKHVKK